LEGPISIPNRYEGAVLAEPYYISTAISVNVSDDRKVNGPLVCTEVLDNKSRCLECSISVVQGYMDPCSPEAYNISFTISCEIGKGTWVLIDSPSISPREAVHHSPGSSERAIAMSKSDKQTLFPEGNNIKDSIPSNIS
jgi:hypothetical protein